jgi:hypothetical protein
MTALLRKHPSASYFILAFALSWGGVCAVIAPGEIPARPARAEQLFPFVYTAMLAGPSIAGILMTAIASGSEGLRAYRGRLLRWRIRVRTGRRMHCGDPIAPLTLCTAPPNFGLQLTWHSLALATRS